jgi:UDP-N-acetylglucosamine acyltransferase
VIHPTAIIHPGAKLHPTVRVGPYAVIDGEVELGADCVVGPHAYLTGRTTAGEGNRFFASCVIGEAPQDLKYKGLPTRLVIGDHNTFREHVTVNRSTSLEEVTEVGSNNLLMAGVHIAHECRLGNFLILANGAILAGHVTVGDRAVLSGSCLVHQFVRVGAMSMMQGGSAISMDLPPFTIVRGVNTLCGLNTVGLRRAGIASEERLELRRLYHFLFRSGMNIREAREKAKAEFTAPASQALIRFLEGSKRGVCTDRSRTSGTAEPED